MDETLTDTTIPAQNRPEGNCRERYLTHSSIPELDPHYQMHHRVIFKTHLYEWGYLSAEYTASIFQNSTKEQVPDKANFNKSYNRNKVQG